MEQKKFHEFNIIYVLLKTSQDFLFFGFSIFTLLESDEIPSFLIVSTPVRSLTYSISQIINFSLNYLNSLFLFRTQNVFWSKNPQTPVPLCYKMITIGMFLMQTFPNFSHTCVRFSQIIHVHLPWGHVGLLLLLLCQLSSSQEGASSLGLFRWSLACRMFCSRKL